MNNEIKRILEELPDYMTDYYKYMESTNFKSRDSYIRMIGKYIYSEARNIGLCIGDLDYEGIGLFEDIIKLPYIKFFLDDIAENLKSQYFYAIKNFYRYLELQYSELEDALPDLDLIQPKQIQIAKKHRVLEVVEIQLIRKKMISTTKKVNYVRRSMWAARDLFMFDMFVLTGIKSNELTQLNIEDVNENEKTITIIGGRNEGRKISVGSVILHDYEMWMDKRENEFETDALFISNRGDRITNSGAEKVIKNLKGLLGEETITTTDLRATAANMMLEKTHDIKAISEYLGIKNHNNLVNLLEDTQIDNKDIGEIMDEYLYEVDLNEN